MSVRDFSSQLNRRRDGHICVPIDKSRLLAIDSCQGGKFSRFSNFSCIGKRYLAAANLKKPFDFECIGNPSLFTRVANNDPDLFLAALDSLHFEPMETRSQLLSHDNRRQARQSAFRGQLDPKLIHPQVHVVGQAVYARLAIQQGAEIDCSRLQYGAVGVPQRVCDARHRLKSR